MPNKWTFTIKPIAELLNSLVKGEWADPFAGNNSPAKYTNDLNPNARSQSHLDAVEFLKSFSADSLDGILLDPPYSLHQVTISYNGYGDKRVIALTPVYDEIARVVHYGGLCISFGWNSNGLGKRRGFEIDEIYLIAHGGHHNDTIVTVERKITSKLLGQ